MQGVVDCYEIHVDGKVYGEKKKWKFLFWSGEYTSPHQYESKSSAISKAHVLMAGDVNIDVKVYFAPYDPEGYYTFRSKLVWDNGRKR